MNKERKERTGKDREGRQRGGGWEYNIDRISATVDSIYPLLTGLLLQGFNVNSLNPDDIYAKQWQMQVFIHTHAYDSMPLRP